jgi:hypothetical protein
LVKFRIDPLLKIFPFLWHIFLAQRIQYCSITKSRRSYVFGIVLLNIQKN